MIEGFSISLETVFIMPRPFITILALPVSTSPIARRVVQTLMGAKFAFKTSTGSCMAAANNL